MKRDLCEIAGVENEDEKRFWSAIQCHAFKYGLSITTACMDIFCMAKYNIEEALKNGTLPPSHISYVELFDTQNFHESYNLIFSNTSELCLFANGDAHKLPSGKVFDHDTLIDKSCPKTEKRIAKVCLTAMENFYPASQSIKLADIEEAKKHRKVLIRKRLKELKLKGKHWTKLTNWLTVVKEHQQKANKEHQQLEKAVQDAKAAQGVKATMHVKAIPGANIAQSSNIAQASNVTQISDVAMEDEEEDSDEDSDEESDLDDGEKNT